jgi:hypothetical protein
MALSSRDLQPMPQRVGHMPDWKGRLVVLRPYIQIGLALIVAYAFLSLLTGWGKIWIDDMRYGRPRTQQLSGMVGHNEANGQPTHFIAMNLNRRVVVIEMPGGDVGKAQTLQGPYLFGANEDLTPVGLRLHDVNGDAKQDLVVSVKSEEIIYINTGDTFRLINADERRHLENQ